MHTTTGHLAEGDRGQATITAIKAMRLDSGFCLIRIDTDAGISGYGECGDLDGDHVRAAIDLHALGGGRLAHLKLIGKDPLDIAVHHHNLFYAYPQRRPLMTVLSGIDMALWDLAGRLAGVPLHRLLGGKRRDRVLAASSVIFDTANLTGIGDQFAELHGRGFTVLKGGWGHDLSIAFGKDAARDVAIVRTIREAVGEDAGIIVDVAAGSNWTASHAITMARAFEPYRLYWLEDALPEGDLEGWKRLRAATATPLCTGEKSWLVPDFGRLIDTGALDVVMIDPGRAEGVTGSKKVIDLAAAARQSWNAHSWSSAINTAASLHLAAASPNVLLLELKPEPSPMQNDIVSDPIVMEDGFIAVRDAPGLGIDVDEAAVRRYVFD